MLLGEGGEPSGETLETLARHVRSQLPKYALPLFLRVVRGDTVQTTGTNKQQKNGLRDQGVEPGKTGEDGMFWLKGDEYVRFGSEDWRALQGGSVKL